jgi:hypothetical protein
MCEMGLEGKLEVTAASQIQIRNRIVADLAVLVASATAR